MVLPAEARAGQRVAAASLLTREEEGAADHQPAVHDGRCDGSTCCWVSGSSGVPVMVKRRNAGRRASHDRYGGDGSPAVSEPNLRVRLSPLLSAR